MGRHKTTARLPKAVIIRCPACSGTQRITASLENSPQCLVCKNCENEIRTPITQCCIICAFSDKKCPYSIKMNAFSKGLELR